MARNLRVPPSVKPGIPKLGVKPKGWREVAFKDILEVVVRPAEVKPNQRYQLINAKRNRGGIVPRTSLLGRQIKTTTQFTAAANDFVISRRQIVHGACGIVPPELDGALVSNEYTTLVPKDGLLLPYLGYYTHSIHFQQTCFNSSVGVAIEKMVFNLNHWLRHRLYLPPIEHQRKVVDVLSTTDRAIAGLEKLIAAKRTLKKGLAQRLLTGQHRLPGFSKPWKKTALSRFGKCIRGVTYKAPDDLLPQDSETTIRLLRAGNIAGGQVIHSDLQFVKAEKVQKSQILQDHDLAICMSSGSKALVGKAARYTPVNGHRYTVGAFCSIFRPEHGAAMTLVPHMFDSEAYRRWIYVLTAGSSINNLTGKDIEGFALPLPTESTEQNRIAAVLSAADREIVLLEKKLTALRELRKGLMQKLLSGS
jgi:type I restriction enzyme S subunit